MSEFDDFLGEDPKEETGIVVNDKYKIKTYDIRNVVVMEKYFTKATEYKPSEEVWKVISYHANLEQAFKSIVNREVNITVSNGLEAVIKKIEELKSFKEVIING